MSGDLSVGHGGQTTKKVRSCGVTALPENATKTAKANLMFECLVGANSSSEAVPQRCVHAHEPLSEAEKRASGKEQGQLGHAH